MGTWHIHIEGHGPHDNDKHSDAEAMTADFVAQLEATGHQISRAEFTLTGSQRELKDRGRNATRDWETLTR